MSKLSERESSRYPAKNIIEITRMTHSDASITTGRIKKMNHITDSSCDTLQVIDNDIRFIKESTIYANNRVVVSKLRYCYSPGMVQYS